MHTEPVEMLTFLAGFAEKPTEKPTEICSDSVSFLFGFFKKKPTETDRLFGEKPKNCSVLARQVLLGLFVFRFLLLGFD